MQQHIAQELSEQAIRDLMEPTETVGREIRCFDVVDSTNAYARQIALEGAADGAVIIADHQTAGRGRMDRSFQSPAGKGIYLSALLRPELPPEKLPPMTAAAGVAVCNAVERVCGVRPGLKWPNDLILGERKLCGILTEMGMDGGMVYLVVGIGLNVSQTAADFTPEVAKLATSLTMELGRSVSRTNLAAALIGELDRVYAALRNDDLSPYLEAYRQDCVNIGKTVQLIGAGESRELAVAIDVDEAFGLVICTDTGEMRTIRSGEVSVRGLYGYIE